MYDYLSRTMNVGDTSWQGKCATDDKWGGEADENWGLSFKISYLKILKDEVLNQ